MMDLSTDCAALLLPVYICKPLWTDTDIAVSMYIVEGGVLGSWHMACQVVAVHYIFGNKRMMFSYASVTVDLPIMF